MTRSHFFTRFLLAFALAFLAGPAALGPPATWPGPAPAMAEGVRFAFNWRGNFSTTTQYISNDLTKYDGSVWRARVASYGQTPSSSSTYWELFVQKGDSGNVSGAVFDVMNYGAVGDGSTDDRAAINLAVEAADAAGGGLVVFRNGKTFYASTTIGSTSTSDNKDGVVLWGYGATLKSGLTLGATTPVIRLMGDNTKILGLTITYNTTPNPVTQSNSLGGDAIYCGGTAGSYKSGFQMKDCRITGAWYAGVRPAYVSRVDISNNSFQNCLATSIFTSECGEELQITGNRIQDSKDDAIFVASGAAANATRRVIIEGNAIAYCNAKAIGVGGVSDCVIANNAIDYTRAPAIQVEAGSSYSTTDQTRKVRVTNNTIRRAGRYYGAAVTGADGVSHSPPSATIGSAPHGIYMDDSAWTGSGTEPFSDIAIDGNSVLNTENTAGYGIITDACRRLSIQGNQVDTAAVGISVGQSSGSGSTFVTDATVRGNALSNIAASAATIFRATNVTFSNNDARTYGAAGGATDRALDAQNCIQLHAEGNRVINDNSAEAGVVLTTCTRSDSAWNYYTDGSTINLTTTLEGALTVGTATTPRALSAPGTGSGSERFGATASTSSGTDATAIGYDAVSSGIASVALGAQAPLASGIGASALGAATDATANYATATGAAAQATALNASALGADSDATASNATCVGYQSAASASNSTALGTAATASHSASVALGYGAATTAANQIIGGDAMIVSIRGFSCKEGSNKWMGSTTLVGGAATVSTTAVTANSRIFLTSQADGGTPGWLRVDTRTAATSFHIQSSSGTDTSTVGWVILEPAP